MTIHTFPCTLQRSAPAVHLCQDLDPGSTSEEISRLTTSITSFVAVSGSRLHQHRYWRVCRGAENHNGWWDPAYSSL